MKGESFLQIAKKLVKNQQKATLSEIYALAWYALISNGVPVIWDEPTKDQKLFEEIESFTAKEYAKRLKDLKFSAAVEKLFPRRG
jgi:hypothetical protein